MLGRFSAGFTLDTYAHVTTSAQKEAAKTMGNILAGSAKTVGVYTPIDPDAIPGIHAGEAVLTETPLGLSIQYPIEITDIKAYYDVMFFNGEEIDFRGRGAMGFTAEDGTEYAWLTMGEGQARDTLTILYYDWDKQLVGDLVFQRK